MNIFDSLIYITVGMKCRWVDKEAWTKEYFEYFGIILNFFMLSPKMLRYLVMFCFLESISQKKYNYLPGPRSWD